MSEKKQNDININFGVENTIGFENTIGSTCFMDIETSGLPITGGFNKYYPFNQTAYYDKSRIIELAYIIANSRGDVLSSHSVLIKPDGFKIENSHIHGIKHEDAEREGVSIKEALLKFDQDLKNFNCDKLVCHNINFDKTIMLSESWRNDVNDVTQTILGISGICTMDMGKKLMKVRKCPKLVELYHYLFKETVVQNHRALDDVKLCMKCYFEMV